MNKITKTSQDLDEMLKQSVELTSRRDFFRKAAVYSASAVVASNVLLPTKLSAEGKGDEAILEEQPWATSLG